MEELSPSMLIILVVSIGLVIGFYVFTQVAENIDNDAYTNESIGGPFNVSSTTTTGCVDHPPILAGSYTVYNSTHPQHLSKQMTATENTHYKVNLKTGCFSNATTTLRYLAVTYTQSMLTSTGSSTLSTMSTTTENAYTLAVVAVIVFAAVIVLGYVFLLGKQD